MNKSTLKLIIFLLILGGLSLFVNLYSDWLWFESIDYEQVFNITLINKVGLYVISFLLALAILYANLLMTRKNVGPEHERPEQTDDGREIIYLDERYKSPWKDFLQGKYAKWVFLGISVLGALLVSSITADKWIIVQQYLNKVPFNTADPIFHKDIGFYFFDLAFYQLSYSTLMTTLVISLIVVGVIYMLNASTDLLLGDWQQFTFAKSHLAVLFALIFALKAWGYKLASYEILFSPSGLVFGATYSDVFAKLLSYKVLIVISLIVAAVIIVNIFIKRVNWIVISIGAWVLAAFLLSSVYPGLVQKLIVQPNEFNKEKEFIQYAIKFTRQAYGLDTSENKEFKVDYNLDINDENNQATIENIRLWDWQPITTTYQSLQHLRPYYVFNNVDIDRYMIDGKYRQVMLSAREIDQAELPERAQTWINQRLMYTHGYGVVVSPVNEIEEEGFPRFFIKDVPPQFSTDLTLKRPEIYFGEVTDSYVIVNTKQKEIDYPSGETNKYTIYKGKNGIELSSLGRKLMFSWVLKDYKILLSSDMTDDSQVLMNRNITERIQKVAPHLGYDSDPYIVINQDDGKLYWMLDAYTVSSKYPYSEPFDNRANNYLRNSVKVVCDAYTGELDFYIADNKDPLIKVYDKIFPGVYKPLSAMPEGLRSHIRYPSDMFTIQAEMYQTFHMTDPYVFYNKEDPWLIPNEVVDDKPVKMEPYYIIMQLPGEESVEYVQMIPFTPKSRPNMAAWMCARMDGDNYGKLLVYRFPKQETIYGPDQVEARINQDTEISRQISLWDQRGSNVFRGNLLVIPMGNSIIYVEPLYLQADNGRLPELKRVIVSYGNRIVMEPSLDIALTKLFGEYDEETNVPETATGDTLTEETDKPDETIEELAKQAREYYDAAQQSLQQGNWAGYGENIDKLNDTIKRMEEAVAK